MQPVINRKGIANDDLSGCLSNGWGMLTYKIIEQVDIDQNIDKTLQGCNITETEVVSNVCLKLPAMFSPRCWERCTTPHPTVIRFQKTL